MNEKFICKCSEIFQATIAEWNVSKVYCKSFDSLLLKCCLMHSASYSVIGTLFRNFIETEKFHSTEITTRIATSEDYSFLLQQKEGLYETPEELDKYVNGGNVILFQKDGNLLGCGYLIKVHVDYNYYDIGM